MISKPVPAHSYYHTCRYIANKPGAALLIAVGVRDHDYKVMAEDFLSQQQMRPGKEKACFHSILSFYPGENPSDDLMREIAQQYLTRLKIVNTQYAISKHTDKDHLHLHIVANLVDNDGKAISDSWIGLKGKKIAQQLTQEYKLIPALSKELKLTHLGALNQAEAQKYTIYMAIAEALPLCRTIDDLEKKLLKQGIETQFKYKGQTQERQGISFKIGKLCFKGSQVDRKYSLGGLQKTLVEQQKQVHQQIPATNKEVQDYLSKQKLKLHRRERTSPETNDPSDKVAPILVPLVGNLIEILLRHEETNGQVPYELTQAYLDRKKKGNSDSAIDW